MIRTLLAVNVCGAPGGVSSPCALCCFALAVCPGDLGQNGVRPSSLVLRRSAAPLLFAAAAAAARAAPRRGTCLLTRRALGELVQRVELHAPRWVREPILLLRGVDDGHVHVAHAAERRVPRGVHEAEGEVAIILLYKPGAY